MGEDLLVLKPELNKMQHRFNEELSKIRKNAAKNSIFLTDATYQKLIRDVENAKTTRKKQPRDYWLLKRYDVITVGNKTKLIFPIKDGVDNIQYYVSDSELFQLLHEVHMAVGHGGRDKMVKELSTKYKNVTRHDVELYIHLCEHCQRKKKVVLKPMFFSELTSRCQVDFIDFQSKPDREYNFVMVYQDHLTKFVVLKCLQCKTADEVARNLVDIFSLLGAPCILQSGSGRDFSINVVNKLKELWPELRIVHGKPGQGERTDKQDIENMLRAWLLDNKSDRWSQGLSFVQFMKNRAYHPGIKKSPYEAFFHCKPKLGLTASFLPADVLKEVNSEEELSEVIERFQAMEKGETTGIKEEPVSEDTDEDTETDCGIKQETEEPLTEEICFSEISIKTENFFDDEMDSEVSPKKLKMSTEDNLGVIPVGTVPVPENDEG